MKTHLPPVTKHLMIVLTTAPLIMPTPIPAQQTSQQASIASKRNSDFLRAVEKGDVKKIKALAGQGVEINFANPVIDIDDLETTASGYQYKFKDKPPIGGSQAMLTAIRSARPESVQALVDLGADIKSEFFTDADLGAPVQAEVFANALRYGLNASVGGAYDLRIVGDHIVSSIRPKPAAKTTYLDIAQQRLAAAHNAKEQGKLQEILNILRHGAAERSP